MNIQRFPFLVAIAFAAASVLSQTPPQPSTSGSQTAGASPASQTNASASLLPPETIIAAELSKSLDAKKVKPGDKIEAKITMDLLVHGQIVVPVDSKVMGHVTEAKPRSKESPESTVGIAFDRIALKNGRELEIRATVQAIGRPLNHLPFPENGNEVPGQAPQSMHAGNTPNWRGTPGGAGGSARPDGSSYPAGSPQDVPAGTVPTESQTAAALDPHSHGVVGMKGLSLNPSDQGSVVSSNTNVHLDGGTQLILRTE
ncbi:MAG TPA: hypothetical protein VNY29_18205 [Terriglobales bacterium]|jgi:hypothetical protein|nr:hypothetical protein [Terriglobales bacterium]